VVWATEGCGDEVVSGPVLCGTGEVAKVAATVVISLGQVSDHCFLLSVERFPPRQKGRDIIQKCLSDCICYLLY
jgi:hypothetical protein